MYSKYDAERIIAEVEAIERFSEELEYATYQKLGLIKKHAKNILNEIDRTSRTQAESAKE